MNLDLQRSEPPPRRIIVIHKDGVYPSDSNPESEDYSRYSLNMLEGDLPTQRCERPFRLLAAWEIGRRPSPRRNICVIVYMEEELRGRFPLGRDNHTELHVVLQVSARLYAWQ